MLVDWNWSSPCYLHSKQPVLHHLCSYCKTVNLYFVYVCLQLCLVWSIAFILWHRLFSIWTSDGIFWFITSFESLNHHSVITSPVPVCYPVHISSESDYNLTVLRSKLTYCLQFQVLQRLSWSSLQSPLYNRLSC